MIFKNGLHGATPNSFAAGNSARRLLCNYDSFSGLIPFLTGTIPVTMIIAVRPVTFDQNTGH